MRSILVPKDRGLISRHIYPPTNQQSNRVDKLSASPTLPTLPQLQSFEILGTMFTDYLKFADLLSFGLCHCERAGRAVLGMATYLSQVYSEKEREQNNAQYYVLSNNVTHAGCGESTSRPSLRIDFDLLTPKLNCASIPMHTLNLFPCHFKTGPPSNSVNFLLTELDGFQLYPTDTIAILEPQNPSIVSSEIHKVRRSADFKAPYIYTHQISQGQFLLLLLQAYYYCYNQLFGPGITLDLLSINNYFHLQALIGEKSIHVSFISTQTYQAKKCNTFHKKNVYEHYVQAS